MDMNKKVRLDNKMALMSEDIEKLVIHSQLYQSNNESEDYLFLKKDLIRYMSR